MTKVVKVTEKKVVAEVKTEVEAIKEVAKVSAEQVKNAWEEKMQSIVAEQEEEAKLRAEEKAKKIAEKKRPGVILSILDKIRKAGDKGTNEAKIIEELIAEFPSRDEKSMRNTVKAQIGGRKRPLRMEIERKVVFNIKTNEAGIRNYTLELDCE